jgi:aminoglycoside phosphotransferase (APT) family kinase protein
MQHLRAHGAPVPEVFGADGSDLVMERLDGPTMLDVLKSRPWRAATLGRQLAALHSRIHAIPAEGLDLRCLGNGDAILHMDLHPDNVVLTAGGPMIIDWTNVTVGDPLADVMNTWMLMMTSSPAGAPVVLRPLLRPIRRAIARGFAGHPQFGADAREWLTRVCQARLVDPNTRDDERARVRALASEYGCPPEIMSN